MSNALRFLLYCNLMLFAFHICAKAQQESSPAQTKKSTEAKSETKKRLLSERAKLFTKGVSYSAIIALSVWVTKFMAKHYIYDEFLKDYYHDGGEKYIKSEAGKKKFNDLSWRQTYINKPTIIATALAIISSIFYANYNFKTPQTAYNSFKNALA